MATRLRQTMADENQHAAPQPPARLASPPAALTWMLLLFFVSGVSGLMYEIIWLRKLTLIFGNTAFAVSTVLAAFMAGLGFGSLWLGRAVEGRPDRALYWYVWLEIGIGFFAVISLPLLDAFGPLYAWLYRTFGTAGYAMGLVRLVCAFITLLPATLLMGGTLPILCRYFVRDDRSVASVVAKLYGANTLGAVAGCFLASFVLVGTLGMVTTVWVGATLNFLAAVGAWVLSRGDLRGASVDSAVEPEESACSFDFPHWHPRLFLVLVALCGFCSLSYEAFWTRMLSHVLGLNVQAFGLMLFTFLLGIGMGSLAAARLKMSARELLRLFIVLELLIGWFGLLSLSLFINLDWFGGLAELVVGSASVSARTFVRFGKCVGIMIVPATLMGAAFPVATTLYAQARERVGERVGTVYAWNTFGAILGSLCSGFVLMPLMGTNASVILVAVLNILVAAVLIPSCPSLYRGPRGALGLAALTLGTAASVHSAAASAGRPVVFSVKSPKKFEAIWHGEDVAGSVTVLESRDDASMREVNINGMSVAYTHHLDVRVQKLLAHLPLLMHASPEDVLVVGFGSGSTSGTTMLHPVRTECVELQRLETVTAQFFTDLNRNVLQEPRFKIHINDGRNFLLMTEKRYDVISRDTLPPKASQDLYSVEFHELCKERLKPGGVVCGFLPTNLCPTADYFKLLVRTFIEVFPEASLWYATPESCLLLGQQGKFEIDYASFVRRASRPEVRADLARIHAADPEAFLSAFITAGDRLRDFVGEGPVATDDRPLGFVFDDSGISPDEADWLAEQLLEAKVPVSEYLVNVGQTPDEQEDVRNRCAKTHRAATLTMRGQHLAWRKRLTMALATIQEAIAATPEGVDLGARYSAARAAKRISAILQFRALTAASRTVGDPAATIKSRQMLATALATARQAVEMAPDFADAYGVLGEAHQLMGNRPEAIKAYRRALEINPQLRRVERNLVKLGAR